MFSTLVKVALFVSVAVQSVSAGFAVSDSDLVQCKEATTTWEPTGHGPYTLLAVPADKPCDEALIDVGDFDTTIAKWNVNLKAGTKVILSVTDSADEEVWSHELTVKDSNDKSCISASSSATPSKSASSSSASSSSSAGSGVEAVGGAANAGLLNNAGVSARQASAPVLAFVSLAALYALL